MSIIDEETPYVMKEMEGEGEEEEVVMGLTDEEDEEGEKLHDEAWLAVYEGGRADEVSSPPLPLVGESDTTPVKRVRWGGRVEVSPIEMASGSTDSNLMIDSPTEVMGHSSHFTAHPIDFVHGKTISLTSHHTRYLRKTLAI